MTELRGDETCPACPIEVRALYAAAHNAVSAIKAAAAGEGEWERAYRKVGELEHAVAAIAPIVERHFQNPEHSGVSTQRRPNSRVGD